MDPGLRRGDIGGEVVWEKNRAFSQCRALGSSPRVTTCEWGWLAALALTALQTRCHPGLDPGSISRWAHSRKVVEAGRPGGVLRDIEMGPGLRRGDIGVRWV